MSAIPGEPLEPKPAELTMKDGRKMTLNVPGLPTRVKPLATGERGAPEPPRDDPRPLHNPHRDFLP